MKNILVTGATGFVGRHLLVALNHLGHNTIGATRNIEKLSAEEKSSASRWVSMDVDQPESIYAALEKVDTAYYLVHRIKAGTDYMQSECDSAERFIEQAKKAHLKRIIYLGGIYPGKGRSSKHLESRVATGEILRNSGIPTFELRAAMVVGHGSMSWTIVRDLSARLPLMVLPKWLKNISWPIAIEDIVTALSVCAEIPDSLARWYELPGPRRISHEKLLRKVAHTMGRRTYFIPVPVLSPKLSSYWLSLVTRASFEVSSELVEGLSVNLEPTGPHFWELFDNYRLLSLGKAFQSALAEENQEHHPSDVIQQRIIRQLEIAQKALKSNP